MNTPSDGPAFEFETDAFLRYIINKDGAYTNAEIFSLVVVANWPPPTSLQSSYENFVQTVRTCFHDTDVQTKRVYFYPFSALHITVATFLPMNENTPTHNHNLLRQHASNILEKATQDVDWPNEPLQLSIESAQIGKFAGILLWRDASGGIQKMRQCIKQASSTYWNTIIAQDEYTAEVEYARQTLEHLRIPSIIHTSFVRFNEIPTTPGQQVQDQFQQRVLPNLSAMFPKPFDCHYFKLICEYSPYMHCPDDDKHVVSRYTF